MWAGCSGGCCGVVTVSVSSGPVSPYILSENQSLALKSVPFGSEPYSYKETLELGKQGPPCGLDIAHRFPSAAVTQLPQEPRRYSVTVAAHRLDDSFGILEQASLFRHHQHADGPSHVETLGQRVAPRQPVVQDQQAVFGIMPGESDRIPLPCAEGRWRRFGIPVDRLEAQPTGAQRFVDATTVGRCFCEAFAATCTLPNNALSRSSWSTVASAISGPASAMTTPATGRCPQAPFRWFRRRRRRRCRALPSAAESRRSRAC